MAEIAQAWVSLMPSMKGFGRSTDALIGPELDKSGKSGGKRFGGAFGKVVGPAMGLAVGAAAINLLKDSIGEAREAEKVGARVANVIKQTGGVANVSAKAVDQLATSISNKTGIDDEQIASSSALLLTFKNVRREGEGLNDVFGRATKAAVDLSASGFGDINGASKQLGKALNDPIKGITALGRAGVTFTEGQKKQIKRLVEQNNLLGAQKIILKEVESQVGGSAAAQATASEKASVAIGNLKEQIGTALLPVIDRMATLITTKVVPSLSTLVGFLQRNPQIIYAVAAAIGAIAAGFVVAFVAANALVVGVAAVIAGLVYAYTRFETFRKIVNAAMLVVKTVVVTAVRVIVATIRGIWGAITAAIGFFRAFYAGVRDFIGRVVATVKGLPGKIKGAFAGAGSWLKDAGKRIIQGLIDGIKSMVGKVGSAAKSVASKIGGFFPGSPIKEGPLKQHGWNQNRPGKLLAASLADGIISGQSSAQASLNSLTSGLNASVRVPTSAQFDASSGTYAGAGSAPDSMPIVDGSQIIGYLRDIATDRARIEIGANDFKNAAKSRVPGAYAGSLS